MAAPRLGRQTPTQAVILPYTESKGQEAVDLYNQSGRTAQPWQELMCSDILATGEDGLWIHTKFGYSVPRRNGKNEVVVMREIWGLKHGENMLHTAHRTTTSHASWERLKDRLDKLGIPYESQKALGRERIELSEADGGGQIQFRTRSSKGGLGEGFDLLVIDEAQEYQASEETALKYVVSDSRNPQTIFCGTPPTPVSSGTVFLNLRTAALRGDTSNTGWAEWSVPEQSDPQDRELWYETNPSMGTILTERKIADEIGTDTVDFNIQRLGLWLRYNLKSAVSRTEWEALQCQVLPPLCGKLFVGIRFGHDGESVAMSIAVKTEDQRVFVEAIDCRPIRDGLDWILGFLTSADLQTVVVDGANGQELLAAAMQDAGLKKPLLPTVKEVILAGAAFEQALFAGNICHMGQPSLVQSVTNCEKRAIGSGGGFGYRSIKDGVKIELMESMILAHWQCSTAKTKKKKQTISY